jgi:hypothetical protein
LSTAGDEITLVEHAIAKSHPNRSKEDVPERRGSGDSVVDGEDAKIGKDVEAKEIHEKAR